MFDLAALAFRCEECGILNMPGNLCACRDIKDQDPKIRANNIRYRLRAICSELDDVMNRLEVNSGSILSRLEMAQDDIYDVARTLEEK